MFCRKRCCRPRVDLPTNVPIPAQPPRRWAPRATSWRQARFWHPGIQDPGNLLAQPAFFGNRWPRCRGAGLRANLIQPVPGADVVGVLRVNRTLEELPNHPPIRLASGSPRRRPTLGYRWIEAALRRRGQLPAQIHRNFRRRRSPLPQGQVIVNTAIHRVHHCCWRSSRNVTALWGALAS
jgi:hypothetical protein